jgi:hypothetical protein
MTHTNDRPVSGKWSGAVVGPLLAVRDSLSALLAAHDGRIGNEASV